MMSDEINPISITTPADDMLLTDDPATWAAEFCRRHNGAVVLSKGAFDERGAATVVEDNVMLKWFTDFQSAQATMSTRRAYVESEADAGRVAVAPPLPVATPLMQRGIHIGETIKEVNGE